MTSLRFVQVDAFTNQKFAGNPCAVVYDAGELTGEQMAIIAREMNLAETAFEITSNKADFGARYFTPAIEIPLAGHPTLSLIWALIHDGKIILKEEELTVTLELKSGVISVEIKSRNGLVEKLTMVQNAPKFLDIVQAHELLDVFGLNRDDIRHDCPIQVVSTGTPQLMIAINAIQVLEEVVIDFQKFEHLRSRYKFFSAHLFTTTGYTENGDVYSRHFDMPPDLIEDPFTGSATGGMASFLWKYNLIKNSTFIAEQGHTMGRPGQAEVTVLGERENITGIKVGGNVVLVAEGKIYL